MTLGDKISLWILLAMTISCTLCGDNDKFELKRKALQYNVHSIPIENKKTIIEFSKIYEWVVIVIYEFTKIILRFETFNIFS